MAKHYCCFCAEPKSSEKLLHIDTDQRIRAETEQKLATLNITFPTYVKDSKFVPRTVCLVCCDALHKASEFLERFKKAQVVLASIYPEKSVSKDADFISIGTSINNDGPHSDGIDEDDQPLSCLEYKKKAKKKVKSLEKQQESIPTIKLELKDDNSNSGFDDSLDVHSLLGAIGDVSIDPNTTLYAKEVNDIPKKSIKCWSSYTWLCKHCNIMFPTLDVLRKHSKEQHKCCFAFTCIDCDEAVEFSKGNSFEEFLNHVSSHRKALQNICPYCDKNYKNEPKHIQSHYPEPKEPCKLCGEILRSEKSLKKHLKDYIDVKQKRKMIKRRGQPLTIQDLTCDICNKVYKNLNSLRDHKKRHTVGVRKREYTCEQCGKTYFTKGSLTSHIMMLHQKVKPYNCRICNKAFLFPNMLRRHVQMHSALKPFTCEQCGRNFRTKRQMENHQIVHTDSMPYVCNFCGKSFRFKAILQTHEYQHTGVRPYSCKDCSLQFTNWSNFNKHMKRRHGRTVAKKKITPYGVFPIDPETGKVINQDVENCEEWKTKVMAPVKRGKKKLIVENERNEIKSLS